MGLFRFQEFLFNPRLVIRGIRKLIVDMMRLGTSQSAEDNVGAFYSGGGMGGVELGRSFI